MWPAVHKVNGRGYNGLQLRAMLMGPAERLEACLGEFFTHFDLFITFTICSEV